MQIETNVLRKSRRRCCLCYALRIDLGEKLGQVAHLDQDPRNFAEDNLAFLCLDHHTTYDSRSSQHKNFTIQEVKSYRAELYEDLRRERIATTQRAVVQMSHYPPGVHGWGLEAPNVVYLCVDVEVKNWGGTPAKVTNILFKPHVLDKKDTLPPEPDYTTDVPQSQLKPHLVAQGFINYRQAFRVSESDARDITSGNKNLYVYGFVDYTDQFKKSHRAGYGRLYKPWRDDPAQYHGGAEGSVYRARSNLVYMTEPGYNDHGPVKRARKKKEGPRER